MKLPIEAVELLLDEIASETVLPAFGSGLVQEVSNKSADEIVTATDFRVEQELTSRLPDLLPNSRCIGEEACFADPELIHQLNQGDVWLIDPIDGTSNFARGESSFAIMVALLRNGAPIAAWMNAPAAGWSVTAEKGSGAWDRSGRVQTHPSTKGDRGTVYERFLPDAIRSALPKLIDQNSLKDPLGSAGCDYHALIRGELDFVIYWRTLSWDHTPGALILEEAGGQVRRFDGRPYIPSEEGQRGLLAACHPSVWDRVAGEYASMFTS